MRFWVPQPEELPEEVDFELEELSAELAMPFNVDESPATKTIVLGFSKESPMRSWIELPELPPDVEEVADLDPEDFKAPPASSLRVEDNP